MAGLLLRDTPVIIDYFIKYVTASTSKVKDYVPEAISQMGRAGEGRPRLNGTTGGRRRLSAARRRRRGRR